MRCTTMHRLIAGAPLRFALKTATVASLIDAARFYQRTRVRASAFSQATDTVRPQGTIASPHPAVRGAPILSPPCDAVIVGWI